LIHLLLKQYRKGKNEKTRNDAKPGQSRAKPAMSIEILDTVVTNPENNARFDLTKDRRHKDLFKNGALQSAIFNSANFSSIATDEKGVIQIFNLGAERMLGYTAAEAVNKLTPADFSDPQELIRRAAGLSQEFETQIQPGFEALVYKAVRGIEDIYELT
jgi:PAS domain-containing protein